MYIEKALKALRTYLIKIMYYARAASTTASYFRELESSCMIYGVSRVAVMPVSGIEI
jgi:hypothetical protein